MTDDNEFFDDYDSDPDDDSSELATCPDCGAEIYEDAVRCPFCGNYITPTTAGPWTGRPLWWIVLAALGVAAFVLALFSWLM